jgi:acyl-CoA synthetase (AMP-forming)/AMP-acid ligase II/acyl carrier protein
MNEMPESSDSIVRILQYRAQHTPDKIAFGMLDAALHLSEISYADLCAKVTAFARQLVTLNITAGRRCLLLFYQGIDVIVALLACNLSGAIPVPLNLPGRNDSLSKWENIAINSRAQCVISAPATVASLKDIFKKSPALAALPLYWEAEAVFSVGEPKAHEIAFLQYTSGSTGDPKGVVVTHFSLLNNLKQMQSKFGFTKDSVMVSWLPFYHDMGLILGILQGIYSGHKVILMRPADFMQQPLSWIRAISDYRATHTGAPNFAFELVAARLEKLTAAEAGKLSLQSLECAICGAEPLNLNTMVRFYQAARRLGVREHAVMPAYGLAEASLVVTSYQAGQKAGWLKLDRADLQNGAVTVLDRGYLDHAQELVAESATATYLVSNGFVLNEHQLTIRNPEDGTELGVTLIGEVCFAGLSVTKGYFNRPEATQRAYVTEPNNGRIYLRTGDLGFKDRTGELYITGRLKDLIIIRGMNYYPQDIERTAFNADPDLRTDGAAAFGVLREKEEQVILIQEVRRAAVRNPQCAKWARNIRTAVLRVHGIPIETIVFVPPMHVPRTTSGKIQRNRAKSRYLNYSWDRIVGISAEEKRPGDMLAPAVAINSREALADLVAGLVARELAVASVELDRSLPFIEQGMNSMMLLSLRSSLEQILGFEVPAPVLFNFNTVDLMSEYLINCVNAGNGSKFDSMSGAFADEVEWCGTEIMEFEDFSEDELLELLQKELGDGNDAN